MGQEKHLLWMSYFSFMLAKSFCKNWQESLLQLNFRPRGDLEFNIIYVSVLKKKKKSNEKEAN